MKPETKKIVTALGLISFTVVMLGIALNFGSVCRWITRLIDVFMPFIIGIVFALFLSVPMNFMERKVLAGKQFDKMRRTLAILITLVLVFGIIGAVGALIVPQLTKTVSSIIQCRKQCRIWIIIRMSYPKNFRSLQIRLSRSI